VNEILTQCTFDIQQHIRGISALSNLKVLNLSIARLTTDLISWLPNLTRLEEISLATTHVTSVWTGELLLRCPRLRTIDLSHTHVDNEIFDYLVRCENLQSVVITGSLIRMDLLSASTFVALERVQVLDHSNDVW
jgi:Leucine-rich repeat (LRR) protein